MNLDWNGLTTAVDMTSAADDARLREAEKALEHGDWNQAVDWIERHDVWIRGQYASLDSQRIARLMATLHGVMQRLIKSRNECAQAMRTLNESKSVSNSYRSSKLGVIGDER